MAKLKYLLFLILLSAVFLFLSPNIALAASVDVSGKALVINTANSYLNFASYSSNVKINKDTGNFSGYAFLEDVGWVDFGSVKASLSTGAVTGTAYVINTGAYLDFTNYGSNVTTGLASGSFSGYVFSQDVGWINFGETGVSSGALVPAPGPTSTPGPGATSTPAVPTLKPSPASSWIFGLFDVVDVTPYPSSHLSPSPAPSGSPSHSAPLSNLLSPFSSFPPFAFLAKIVSQPVVRQTGVLTSIASKGTISAAAAIAVGSVAVSTFNLWKLLLSLNQDVFLSLKLTLSALWQLIILRLATLLPPWLLRRKKSTGFVFDEKTRIPIGGVFLVFYSKGGNIKVATSSIHGDFFLTNIIEDDYLVKTEKVGYRLVSPKETRLLPTLKEKILITMESLKKYPKLSLNHFQWLRWFTIIFSLLTLIIYPNLLNLLVLALAILFTFL